jgi:hypothetical protein
MLRALVEEHGPMKWEHIAQVCFFGFLSLYFAIAALLREVSGARCSVTFLLCPSSNRFLQPSLECTHFV